MAVRLPRMAVRERHTRQHAAKTACTVVWKAVTTCRSHPGGAQPIRRCSRPRRRRALSLQRGIRPSSGSAARRTTWGCLARRRADVLSVMLPDDTSYVTEHIKSFLALQLPQVDLEVDFIVSMANERPPTHRQSAPDPQVRALGIRRAGQHGLRSGHRRHGRAFGVPALPASLRDKIEDRLPVLHRGIRYAHVRQRPVKSGSKKQLTSSHSSGRPAVLPGSPTRRTPVSPDRVAVVPCAQAPTGVSARWAAGGPCQGDAGGVQPGSRPLSPTARSSSGASSGTGTTGPKMPPPRLSSSAAARRNACEACSAA